MILPTAEALERRRRGYRRRSIVVVLASLLMLASILTPHIAVQSATGYYSRSLLPASRFFFGATPGGTEFLELDAATIGFALSLSYFALAMQQVGLLLGIGFMFVLAAEDVGRWTRRFCEAAGWFLVLSAPTVVLGYQLLERAGAPAFLGIAWVFALLAGLVVLIGARQAKKRMDSTWFWTRTELDGYL